VKRERLEEQAVPTDALLKKDRFEEFLKVRAENLAQLATAYVQGLAK
jgi:hypothetical protein